jgi:hypothetical protein
MTTKKTRQEPPKSLEKVEGSTPDTTLSIDTDLQYDAPEITASWQDIVGNGKGVLYRALAMAQAECQNVVMNRVNPHFRSKYADLSAVRDAIIPIFSKHGIAIIQAPHNDGFSGFVLETFLLHESGGEMKFSFPLPNDTTNMQKIGSAISYARRYTLSAIAGIASEEDDDGNAATNPNGGGQSAGGRGAAGGPQARGEHPPATNGGIVL